jgi:DNA replication and repair protein RecF
MILKHIEVRDFRNIRKVSIDPDICINVIHGDNGTGKSNFLESISVLCGVKSFRHASDEEMSRWNGSGGYFCRGLFEDGRIITAENGFLLESGKRKRRIQIDGSEIKKLSEYYGLFPFVSFAPEDIHLIDGVPELRRRYVDSVLSKFDAGYMDAVITYKKICRYINTVIRSENGREKKIRDCSVWRTSFSKAVSIINSSRKLFIDTINPALREVSGSFFPDIGLYFSLEQNIDETDIVSLETIFHGLIEKSVFAGKLIRGPHRDNFNFVGFDERVFGSYASQGQKRSAAMALKIAEKRIIENQRNTKAILLFDDILSELDKYRREKLFSVIDDQNQVFITIADPGVIEGIKNCSFIGTEIFNEV